jgi:hypothetical protein
MLTGASSKELLVVARFFAALPQRKLGWLQLTCCEYFAKAVRGHTGCGKSH